LSERTRLERLRQFFSRVALPAGVTLGIGDDAAVLAPESAHLVWTIDAAVEGVHFRRDWMTLEDIGYRSLMTAASDLAAMGARPRGVLSALTLPPHFSDGDLDRLMRGQRDAASALGTGVIGGNLARGGELSITTTVLGAAAAPLLRAGAVAADIVAIAGEVGLARTGIEALQKAPALSGAIQTAVGRAIAAYRRPRALLEEGALGAARAHAAIDVSDGLALDASRLAAESGVRVVLEANAVRAVGGNDLRTAATALGLDPLDVALYGGDDYALLMTFPPGELPKPFRAIGTCVAGSGVALKAANGALVEIEARGFDHFRG
jgi:thiamine-monophosphate kinase